MNDIKNKVTLRSIPLFSELSIEQLRKLTSISEIKKISSHSIIFMEGDFYKGFYVQLKGSIKIYKTSVDGKEAVVHIIKPFNVFADIPLFEGNDYPVSAQTLEESIVLFVPKEGFINLIKTEPDISLKMLAGFAKRLKSLISQVEDLTTKEVKNRLAKYLIKEIQNNKTENLPEPYFKLAIPKSTLASYLGTITETLSRTFKKFQDQEVIRVQGKSIFVTNYLKLKKLAQNCE
ncbi:MAG: Crp/Fnr family transcriptional regulator [Ignavibacteriae bacterium]|nr:Crp/Fnr family transcriptional regulator [Ignavibacteriota bacterium]MCB0753081.1 Crp/Fnr family transcriptional regulator [Ignavibacteriota bacterium]MCB9247764.1 Crp/Fnr family transcriptional regulator [Ignavibacteriales bacterium]